MDPLFVSKEHEETDFQVAEVEPLIISDRLLLQNATRQKKHHYYVVYAAFTSKHLIDKHFFVTQITYVSGMWIRYIRVVIILLTSWPLGNEGLAASPFPFPWFFSVPHINGIFRDPQ